MDHHKEIAVIGSRKSDGTRQQFRHKAKLTDHDKRPTLKAERRNFLTLQTSAGFLREGVTKTFVLLGAGIVTVGLLGLMIGLISEEFEPQDIIELATFEINSKPDDLPLLTDRTPPKLLDRIEVPPPPPVVDVLVTDRPSEPVYTPGKPRDSFDPKPFILPTKIAIYQADTEPTPLVRTSPMMPPRATRSGHCRISFDISPDGKPYNVQASLCTQSLFERPAIRSVQKWVYRPEIQDGLPVTRTGLETMIRFNLTDERGVLIPE